MPTNTKGNKNSAALLAAADDLWADAVAGGDDGTDTFSVSRSALATLASAVAECRSNATLRRYAAMLRAGAE